MAKSFLNQEHERWLFYNFSTKTNEELALMLSKMVEKDNARQIARLNEILKDVTQRSVQKAIKSELAWRSSFEGFSPAYIKQAGRRLRCGRKTYEHLSSNNREKARRTNIKRWMKLAQDVKHPLEWMHTFRRKEVRISRVSTDGELKRMRNAINYFNRVDSEMMGYTISSEHISEANLLRVIALPIRDRR